MDSLKKYNNAMKAQKESKMQKVREVYVDGVTTARQVAELIGSSESSARKYIAEIRKGMYRKTVVDFRAEKRREFIKENWDKPSAWLVKEIGCTYPTLMRDIVKIEAETGMVREKGLRAPGMAVHEGKLHYHAVMQDLDRRLYAHAKKVRLLFLETMV